MDKNKAMETENEEFTTTIERYERVENYNTKIVNAVSESYRNIINLLEPEPNREGVQKTPERSAKAMQFLTHGYDIDAASLLKSAMFKEDHKHMVLVKDIEIYSMCEHHMLPFIGKCHVAYIPNGKVLGLSKVARIVDMFARRLQIQENLTNEIAQSVLEITGAAGVGVIIEAKHMCMMMRGVEKQNSVMRTSSLIGSFRDNQNTRAEFLSLVNGRW